MAKQSYEKLIQAQQKRAAQISNIREQISNNAALIAQYKDDKAAALRTKDQAAAQTAQFNSDALEVENRDLTAQMKKLQNVRISAEDTNVAWNTDVLENPEYRAEIALYQATAALYDAVCVRAQNKHAEYADEATKLTDMCEHKEFYGLCSPGKNLDVCGYLDARKEHFTGDRKHSGKLTPEAVDKLISLLQSVKENGVDSIF